MKHSFLVVFLISFLLRLHGQQSAIYTHQSVTFNQAVELYNNHQLLAAQRVFDKVANEIKTEQIKSECTYYVADCAIKLDQKDADKLMEDFIQKYPNSIRINTAYKDIAAYHFNQKIYPDALRWYKKVEEVNLSPKDTEQLLFNKGYSYFKMQEFEKAKSYFDRLKDSKPYANKAKYYLGFMAYKGDDYEEASKLFDDLADRGKEKNNVSYFQSDINFKAGKFQEAIHEGVSQLQKSNPSEKSELNKIIGESYFNLGQYQKAIPYLKGYKGRKGKWNNTDYYQIGYAYYKKGSHKEAIAEFAKIIGGKNAIAQNAYYHLADAYLATQKKQQALYAFKNASEMDFEPKIKQDALYNYAKLSYELGNSFESPSKILQSYLDIYPNSSQEKEIKDILISSYITSKNYKEALVLLEKTRDFENSKVYQKVAYYRAVELFEEKNYIDAKRYFDIAITHQRDPVFSAKGIYWTAEIEYLTQNYEASLISFKQFENAEGAIFTKEKETLDYQLGYVYFEQKEYDQAAIYFERFAQNKKGTQEQQADAFLRLGDSYFISSAYWPAIEAYNEAIAIGEGDLDYAHFQKAISYGFVKKNSKKITELKTFLKEFPSSMYRDDAFFALADTYVADKEYDKGIRTYEDLINELPQSTFVAKALLKQGLVFYNQDKGEEALSKFKKVVSEYPGSEASVQAIKSARLIYVDINRIGEYVSWVKGLSFVDISNSDLDNTSYEAAEKQVLSGDIHKAIKGLESYLSHFPKGIHALKSHFQLAQLYVDAEEKSKAIPHYQWVLGQQKTRYTEQSLVRVSQIYLDHKEGQKAIPFLKRLEKEADVPQNIIFAQANLMKDYYQKSDYQKAITYSEHVLVHPKVKDEIKIDALLFLARAAFHKNDIPKARKAYAIIEKSAKGELAAEAFYYKAYFLNQEQRFKQSNKVIQELAKSFSAYQKYGAMGLVLMAKNFYGLDDAYQASYILESVIKNFDDYPKVVSEAKLELQKIKAEEAKTNSSILIKQ